MTIDRDPPVFVPRRRTEFLVRQAAAMGVGLMLSGHTHGGQIWPFTEAGRFLIPLVPCLLVVATEAIGAIAASLGQKPPRLLAAIAVLALAIPYSTYALVTNRAKETNTSGRFYA